MNIHGYINILKQKKQTVFSIVFLFLIATIVLTMIQPFKYGSEAKILIVQENQRGINPYQVNKSNEYVSDVLADVIIGNSFFNEIINSGFDVDRDYFSDRTEDQSKEWKKTAKANSGSHGVITLSVFHKDKYQADQIIRSINAALKDKHMLYHGLGDNIKIRIIDQPVVSDLPVKPNIVLNLILGALFGLLFALAYAYLFPEDKYGLRLWPKTKIRQKYDEAQEPDFGGGVDKNKNYDVEEAIKKLRKRGKPQSIKPRQDIFENNTVNEKNYQNNSNDSDYNDIARQGNMKNIL